MTPTNSDTTAEWLAAVRRAATDDDLVEVMKRYVASRAPQDLMELPAACRPPIPRGNDDILESAVVLTREELKCESGSAQHAALRQMAAVFAEASLRLSRMIGHGSGADPKPAPE